ncbi:PREDICTED: nibrin isoform X2 [Dinoponera quadriceps]|uniref:Nibrin isoform X2 n=1 Tax=Dinoponera quadriceps TaxID=609295 RepID=A0A6P3XRZ4_DINQU|nr:PREDICTED: nibrin isoform X2 [Dinoponera quadriceps]XP_014480834.1 PREDICTED: nibrin isoform X2 [Dinoponera quadriceps]XP_014480835.1 PREDICTED: nibrin isoform X2 [Dinoponera quadriceps]
MWCLKEHEGRCIYILLGRQISFGKSLSDIKIEGDTTISRLHAIVSVESCGESELQHKCVIYDKSKYGTYILRDGKEKKLIMDEKFVLRADDKVKFGLRHNIFTVTYHPFVVATSSLSKEETDKLKNIMKALGGILSDNWNNSCTCLTVPERFLFTIKLACALASAKTIVTIAYWEAVMEATEEMKELPKIDDFLPTVKEDWLHAGAELFLPKEERRMLFRGLSFVHFCAKQYAAYFPIITAAGGKSCVYPTRKPLTPRDLTAKNAIVIQQPANDSSQFTIQVITDYPTIYNKLSKLKRRMICDSEIPLAILYCSTEKYCNPEFNFGTLLKSSTQTSLPSGLVIVGDTQDTLSTSTKRKIGSKEQQRIIPETIDSQYDNDIAKKARLSLESREKVISGNNENGSDVVCIFSSKNNKQPRIIPETCDFDKSIANDSFPQSNAINPRVIPESCDRSSIGSWSAENEQRVENVLREDVESRQRKEIVLEKRQLLFQKDLLPESNDTTFMENNLSRKRKSLLFEKSCSADKDDSAGQKDENESRKNSRGLRIVSIEKIASGERNLMEEDVLKKDHSRIEESLDFTLRQQDKHDEKIEIIDVDKGNEREEEKSREMGAEKVKIEEKDETSRKRPRKMGTNWYDRYLGCEYTNKVLRKDAPCGKRFVKVPVPIPVRKLKSDDFVL